MGHPGLWAGLGLIVEFFGAPEEEEGEGGPEADVGVGEEDAGEDEDAEAGEDDECGVETGARGAEDATGEGFDEESEGEDGERERDARGYGEGSGRGRAEELGDAHGDGHRPVEERGFLEVADAVGVEGDVVVAEEHLAGDFGVDGVGVVEERGSEEGEAGVEGDPEEEDGKERGARTWGRCGRHWDKCMRGVLSLLQTHVSEARHGAPRLVASRTLAAMAKMKPMKAAVQESLVQLAGGGPPAEMVFGDWYPALRAEGLKRGDTAVDDAVGDSDAGGPQERWCVVCDAGSVSASWDSSVGGVV